MDGVGRDAVTEVASVSRCAIVPTNLPLPVLSPTFAGFVSDTFSSNYAFFGLAAIAVVGLAVVALLMPETRPASAGAQS